MEQPRESAGVTLQPEANSKYGAKNYPSPSDSRHPVFPEVFCFFFFWGGEADPAPKAESRRYQDVLHVAREVCSGMAYVHAHNVATCLEAADVVGRAHGFGDFESSESPETFWAL